MSTNLQETKKITLTAFKHKHYMRVEWHGTVGDHVTWHGTVGDHVTWHGTVCDHVALHGTADNYGLFVIKFCHIVTRRNLQNPYHTSLD
jgi:hypothetical protein